jgi:hypothetical protein
MSDDTERDDPGDAAPVSGDPDELVMAASEQGETFARMLAQILESEGIEVLLKSNQAFGALPFTVDGMGEVRILVRRSDLERARELIAAYRENE